MLDVLRASKGGIITWIFLAAIIVMFVVSFGPGSLMRGQGGGCGAPPNYAARVNGETIPAAVFASRYQRFADTYERDPQMAAMLPYFAQQLLEGLVDEALLSQEADKRGIAVTSEDLNQRVKTDPTFWVDGQFSMEKYTRVANSQWGSRGAFEAMIKRAIRVDRLRSAMTTSVQVPETEVHDTWKKMSDTFDLSYVLFATADARAEVKVSDADVKAFAAKEGPRIEKDYKDNAARWDQPEKVRARHILAKAEGSDDAAAKKKIEDAIARLQKGEDFAKVAAELSDDVNTKSNGGDLGLITAGQVDDAFSKAALALKAGQLSGPVKTPAGWHVIRVDEVVPAKKVSLEAARPEIARELLIGDRAAALAKEKAQAALKAAQSGKSLADLFPAPRAAAPAAEGKPAVSEVKASLTWGGKPIFERSTGQTPGSAQSIPGLEGSGDLLKDALAADTAAVLPKVYTIPAGQVVAVVKSRHRPDEKKYPEEREAHLTALRTEKTRQYEATWIQQLRSKATIEVNEGMIPRARGGQPGQAPLPEE